MKRFGIANLLTGTITADKYSGEVAEIADEDTGAYLLEFPDGYAEWFPKTIVKEIDACTKCGERPADIDDFGVCLCNKCLKDDLKLKTS